MGCDLNPRKLSSARCLGQLLVVTFSCILCLILILILLHPLTPSLHYLHSPFFSLLLFPPHTWQQMTQSPLCAASVALCDGWSKTRQGAAVWRCHSFSCSLISHLLISLFSGLVRTDVISTLLLVNWLLIVVAGEVQVLLLRSRTVTSTPACSADGESSPPSAFLPFP